MVSEYKRANDAQGCRNTVEVLALLLPNPAPPSVVGGTKRPDGLMESR